MSFENKEKQENQQTEEKKESATQAAENGLPKTQEELDAIIDARLARERKKMAKQQQGQTPPAQQTAQTEASAQQTATPPAVDTAMQRENLMLKAQVTAIKDGVDPSVVEDAVYLAMREAEKDGDADEDDIKEALKIVLKRHPEWSAKKEKKEEKEGGFKVGAGQTDKGSGSQKNAMPTGKVIL